MKIAILLFDGITALDAIGPYESLARIADNEIVFVAKQSGAVRTGDGFLALNADAGIADVREVDVLIIPGGHSRGLKAAMSAIWICAPGSRRSTSGAVDMFGPHRGTDPGGGRTAIGTSGIHSLASQGFPCAVRRDQFAGAGFTVDEK